MLWRPTDGYSFGNMSIENAALIRPLMACNNVSRSLSKDLRLKTAEMLFPVFHHQEAIKSLLFLPTDGTANNFIVQSICFVHSSGTFCQVSHNVAKEINVSVMESREWSSKFGGTYLQAFSEKKPQAQKFYFQLL